MSEITGQLAPDEHGQGGVLGAVIIYPTSLHHEAGGSPTSTKGSLGVSQDAIALRQELLLRAASLARWQSDGEYLSPVWTWKSQPEEAVDPPAAFPTQQSGVTTWNQEMLECTLARAFDEDYLEAGASHPAEAILSTALSSGEGAHTLEWLTELCGNEAEPALAASTMRCLGRLHDPGNLDWRRKLVGAGLASGSLEVRDATAQACEEWAEPGLLDLLKDHREVVNWLRAYIDAVVKDIET